MNSENIRLHDEVKELRHSLVSEEEDECFADREKTSRFDDLEKSR